MAESALKLADRPDRVHILLGVDADDPKRGEYAATMPHQVVLLVNLSQFFRNAAGTGLVDPDSANKGGPNESQVTENIKIAFESFENDS